MLARIKKGDLVKVISGKYKGKTGRVLQVLPKKSRVIVEGVNMQVRNKRPSGEDTKGTQERTEGTIHISNVMPVDPATASHAGSKDEAKLVRGTRVGVKVLNNGKKVRVAVGRKSSGEVLDSTK